SPPRAFAARRNAHYHQFHWPSFAHPPRRIRRSLNGSKRLGPRSRPSGSDIFPASPRTAWSHAYRQAFRRGKPLPRRHRAGTNFRGRIRASARILTLVRSQKLITISETNSGDGTGVGAILSDAILCPESGRIGLLSFIWGSSVGGRDPLRPDESETVVDGATAVRAVSDSAIPPPSDPMMTVEIGPDSPTIADAPRTRQASFVSDVDQATFPPGTVLGQRYEILETLGRGGMGAVYKARDREVNRVVALKVIRPDLAGNSSIIDRFKQELILSREVTHKNVVRIYDLGDADGVKFITMEYVEGNDLRSLIMEKKKFSPSEAVEIMLQICRALEAAHTVGVIHRDLKPQNIMSDNQGRIVVMDFGLARLLESNGMTQTGALVGTMEYMSPEQALGSTLDQRSDLFTLGLIFYELLTGKMPFAADSALA